MMPPRESDEDAIAFPDGRRDGATAEVLEGLDERAVVPSGQARCVLRVTVRNHPGVLSHVSGLFARRAFNVDAILCLPLGDAARSAILILVRADGRLEQLVRQLTKLEDVVDVRADPAGRQAFVAAAAALT